MNAGLPVQPGAAIYGRARIELDPDQISDTRGLSRTYFVNAEKHLLSFHSWQEQLTRFSVHAPKAPPPAPAIAEPKPTQPLEMIKHLGDEPIIIETKTETASAVIPEARSEESGISLPLTGHAVIQTTVQEIREMLAKDGKELPIYPGSIEISGDRVKPQLSLSSDGSFRVTTRLDTPYGRFEAHGLPQGSLYLLLNLQLGLGGTTGYSVTQLAHNRRGAKRERDLKVLRHLGFASLIFYDAALFALGEPLSDGSVVNSEGELLASLYTRLGALVLKGEGFPTQDQNLAELCSKNVTTLIEGGGR